MTRTVIDWRERGEREKSHWDENPPHVPSQVRRADNVGRRVQVTARREMKGLELHLIVRSQSHSNFR